MIFLDQAAWRDNLDIGNADILKQILDENGFNSSRLLEEANSKPIKDILFKNTERYSLYLVTNII